MARNASIAIAITTYNRPESCLSLLHDIARDKASYRLRVVVYDDASSVDYKPVRQFCRLHGWQYIRATENHGKRRWWMWVNEILAHWSKDAADHFYFIQDDLRLCNDFFRRTLGLWDQIADPNKVSLYLLRDASRDPIGTVCWTGFKSRIEGVVERTQWADCNAILLNKAFIDTLGGALEPIPESRWAKDPTISSGVGQQWSQRLHAAKKGLFRPMYSYVLHMDTPSHMNPEARQKTPLRAVKFIDGPADEQALHDEYDYTTASLATIPSRRAVLQKVVARLLPQVDHLNVYLNETPAAPGVSDYPNIPKFLRHEKISAVFSQDTEYGDRGDAGKAYWASELRRGYHIIVDDDVLYPPDFVEKILAGVKRYNKRAVVGFHGAILTEPFKSYYGSRRVYHFNHALGSDTPVHLIAGAGGIAYHTDAIRVHRDDFKRPNMGDIWLGLLTQQQRVPMVCLAHQAGWIVDDKGSRADSIYAHSKTRVDSPKNTADVQTQVVRENMPWVVRSVEGQILLSVGRTDAEAEAEARKQRRQRREAALRKAVFLVASTRRPVLLAGVLRSLQNQEPVPGWKYSILVGGAANDPGRLIAELAGASYLPCEGPYPGHKINAMMRATDAELLMLADDDDLQSPWRFRASVEAYLAGSLWSSTSGFLCLDQATGRVAWWTGPPTLVGTTISIQRELAVAAGGWPSRPEGKDGLFATRVRKFNAKAGCADLVGQIGGSTVTIQHNANIHRRRPFPGPGESTRRGKFDVAGREAEAMHRLPASLRSIVEGVLNDVPGRSGPSSDHRALRATCPFCGHTGPFRTYRGRPGEQCVCGSLHRHRRQWRWLLEEGFEGPALHCAPEAPVEKALRERLDQAYVSFDIRPELGTTVVGDLRDIPFPDNHFGLVFSSHVLEHIEEADRAIAEIHRVLQPEGLALLDVPAHPGKTRRIPPDAQGHVWEPGTDWSLKYEAVGFEVLKSHRAGTVLCRKRAE